jgi:hypothetical protein
MRERKLQWNSTSEQLLAANFAGGSRRICQTAQTPAECARQAPGRELLLAQKIKAAVPH